MATTVGQLTIEMAANVARLRTDMDEAKRVVGGAMESVQGAVDIAKQALIGMAGAFTAEAIISQVTSLIGGLAELDDAAESAGSSVETMSALLGVGVQSGKNLNEVVGIVTALNRAMVSAEADTSKAAIAFKALGLNLTGFSDSGLALQAFAQKLGEFEDGANKSQIAIMALGRSGAAAVPFLKDLADAGAITGKITGDQAAEAEKLEKAFAALRYEATVSKQQLLSEYIPAWAATAKEFREARDAGFGLLEALTLVAGQNKRDQIEAQSKVVADLRDKLNEGAGAVRRFFDPGVEERMQAQLNLEEGRLKKLVEQANAEEQRRSAVKKSDDQLRELLDKIRQEEEQQRKATEARKAAEEAARKLNDAYFAAIGISKDYTEKVREYETLLKTGKITQDEYTGAIKRLGESQPVVKQYTEDQTKASKALEEAQKTEHGTLKELAKLYEDSQKPIRDQTAEVDKAIQAQKDENEKIGLTKGALGDLTAKRWEDKAAATQWLIDEANVNGALGTEYKALVDLRQKYLDAAAEVRKGERLTAIQEEAEKAKQEWDKQSGVIEKSLTDALLRGFEGGKGFAQNLVQSMKNLFNTLILRPVIQAVVQPVAGAITGMLGLTGTANAATGGLNVLSGAGGAASLFGEGSFMSSFFGGASATSEAALALGEIGAGGAAAAGGGAFAALGTALPYLGVGLAVASALGLFGSKHGPKSGGSYDSSGAIGRLFTPNDADQSAGTIGAGILDSIKTTVGDLGGTAADLQLAFGFDKDPLGTAGSRLASLLRTKSGNVLVNDMAGVNVGRDDSTFTAGVASESARLVLAGIQASTLPDDIRAIFDRLDVSTVTSDELATAIKDAKALVPKSEAQTALDAALNDPGTQAAVSTEVSRLIDLQTDAYNELKAQGQDRRDIGTSASQAAATLAAIVRGLVDEMSAVRQAITSLATAPEVVRA